MTFEQLIHDVSERDLFLRITPDNKIAYVGTQLSLRHEKAIARYYPRFIAWLYRNMDRNHPYAITVPPFVEHTV